ncbi:TIGR02285 family protein [Desulfogranum mediterraneum]|uniref:TIGR02285 family protein n=1 Tax=Desulfogranum mediterraneum TaxID=160661 RepID=UPI00040D111E|nr:TIGR02285 family protein [Desulfogranum mediterraneum]
MNIVCPIRPIILAAILGLLSATAGLAKEPLYWLEAVAPPFFIHQGALKGQGYEDLLTALLKEQLPDYEHRHLPANISRHYQQWKQGENACSLAMYKTPEREEFAYFSIPSVITLPPVLIISKDNWEKFDNQSTVLLKDLLNSKRYLIGRARNRSYGTTMDEILDTHGSEATIFSYEGPELTLNLFKMLLAGRIDALPGLPEEAMYLAETMGIRDRIMTLGIVENLSNPRAMLTHVACSKTEWGQQTIAVINTVLKQQRPTERYRRAYERWLDPASIPLYRKFYQEVFLDEPQANTAEKSLEHQ